MEKNHTWLSAELFEEFRGKDLPIGEYVIVSGWTLAARWIRKCSDIDIAVSDGLWENLLRTYLPTVGNNIVRIVISENIEAFGNWSFIEFESSNWNPIIEEQISRAEIINWLSFQSLRDCIWFKSKSWRDKDKQDIGLIKSYIEKHPWEKDKIDFLF
ncbi:MAG: hypothetical protein ACD_2C00052G0013 [uncultured bacterium (gcode 4)]|uniref:Uncharacterized protein n=1 Tax=uncultured bacterium (gcode 4) TaxID=1234023 RepID=K2G6U7_9BACT|nr:MAG: hypothetical protein ACD_2C00052G0013 [uncultured bacterium (gcode 4)]